MCEAADMSGHTYTHIHTMCEAADMSGHTYTHIHTHTHTQDNYSNPCCAHANRGLIRVQICRSYNELLLIKHCCGHIYDNLERPLLLCSQVVKHSCACIEGLH